MNSFAKLLRRMSAPALFLTTVLLTGCANTRNAPLPAPSFRFIPAGLTTGTRPPPFPEHPTWGNIGIWSDSLLDALETCNADKRAIEAMERRRLNR
ncbi:hypothetical protein MZD85_28155, partial [Escherichia coli]|nr:hypothetical protein [Escherichia coli]